jgi:hypothetical protein
MTVFDIESVAPTISVKLGVAKSVEIVDCAEIGSAMFEKMLHEKVKYWLLYYFSYQFHQIQSDRGYGGRFG